MLEKGLRMDKLWELMDICSSLLCTSPAGTPAAARTFISPEGLLNPDSRHKRLPEDVYAKIKLFSASAEVEITNLEADTSDEEGFLKAAAAAIDSKNFGELKGLPREFARPYIPDLFERLTRLSDSPKFAMDMLKAASNAIHGGKIPSHSAAVQVDLTKIASLIPDVFQFLEASGCDPENNGLKLALHMGVWKGPEDNTAGKPIVSSLQNWEHNASRQSSQKWLKEGNLSADAVLLVIIAALEKIEAERAWIRHTIFALADFKYLCVTAFMYQIIRMTHSAAQTAFRTVYPTSSEDWKTLQSTASMSESDMRQKTNAVLDKIRLVSTFEVNKLPGSVLPSKLMNVTRIASYMIGSFIKRSMRGGAGAFNEYMYKGTIDRNNSKKVHSLDKGGLYHSTGLPPAKDLGPTSRKRPHAEITNSDPVVTEPPAHADPASMALLSSQVTQTPSAQPGPTAQVPTIPPINTLPPAQFYGWGSQYSQPQYPQFHPFMNQPPAQNPTPPQATPQMGQPPAAPPAQVAPAQAAPQMAQPPYMQMPYFPYHQFPPNPYPHQPPTQQ
jgi:hypothetical protein